MKQAVKPEKAWYVGLKCVHCGKPVYSSKANGMFVMPIVNGKTGVPWARHVGTCP